MFFVPDPQSTGPPGEPGPVGTGDVASAYTTRLGVGVQAFVAGPPFVKLTNWLTVDGLAVGATPDQVNDRIVIINGGVWRVDYSITYQATASVTFSTHLRVNGVEAPEVQGQAGNFATSWPLQARGSVVLAPGDVLEVYGVSSGAATLAWQTAQFNAMRLA